MSLTLLHQDPNFVAIYKPSGLLVHRTFIDAGETRFCVQLLRDQLGREVFPCHRLDKPTSGILLFALNRPALQRARSAFDSGQVIKRYHAIVRGWIPESGLVDYPLRYEIDAYEEKTRSKKVQEARTHFRRLQKTEIALPVGRYPSGRFSSVELMPATGRKHQLRRHLAHLRHPIVGDTRHGDGAQNRFFRKHFGSHRLLLVATELRFAETSQLQGLHIEASLDDDFLKTTQAAGLH